MTRVVPSLSFTVVAAPSRSRPQLSFPRVRLDAIRLKNLMGLSGVGGLTEIAREPAKQIIRDVFHGRVGLKETDCPLVWTDDWEVVTSGVDFGCAGIPVVAPVRYTSWALLRHASGFHLGVISTHMTPGGNAPHPSRAQRLVRPLIRLRWRRHAARIQRRLDWLKAHSDGQAMVGDINQPGTRTWDGLVRVTGPGLLYIGVSPNLVHVDTKYYRQNADHKAAAATVTVKGI